ncbi:hypothetical protein CNMCM6106_008367 [Aspergillus hiratsukae]|uniref:HAT C-terminal dimerisation domain-containing protein n=1 Tax=Aspergillus hiratsukae TaxID=1194566 RepID=A0A8H6V3S6_9EURO|nr:hypothetical protein CNMCM6106_008367 [Aspergillus hiratsukae]
MAQLAPSQPVLLKPKTARRRLQAMVKEEHRKILSTLPPTAKVSIALDCWTSPFQQAFMAITGYFIDRDWNYREILLGFEPVYAVFINASPQRREAFLGLQAEDPKLVPIQDVRTRWNSTFLMLRRAKRLSSIFNLYCDQHGHPQFKIDKEEWRQIDYLLCITQPFYKFTTGLSKTKNVTIHNVFRVYNRLFDHLDTSICTLQRKRVSWKQVMLHALEAARDKLKFYYDKTEDVHGNLYAIGTILAPQHKLKFFSSKEWEMDPETRLRYKAYLERYMEPYQQQQPVSQSLPTSAVEQDDDDLDYILDDHIHPDTERVDSHDELQQYLETRMFFTETFLFELTSLTLATKNIAPLTFWREKQQQLPTLASVARDIFSIPATGAGVERLFNSARDICHYRRGSLNATTIQDIMMFRCISRFDIEEDAEELDDEALTWEEREEANERSEAQLPQHTPDPISDEEEDDSVSLPAEPTVGIQMELPTQRAVGKRRLSKTSEQDDGDAHGAESDDDALPLPKQNTQIRTSGRQKRPRREDNEFTYY